jgi:hypothetical protein
MHARLRPNKNCGCTIEQAMFVIALYLWLAHHAQR